VCWLLALHHTHLHCRATQLIIQLHCLQCSSALLVLGWMLALKATPQVMCILRWSYSNTLCNSH
jgi:TRAP-type C4-dicarboxylate transport system permease small subunit